MRAGSAMRERPTTAKVSKLSITRCERVVCPSIQCVNRARGNMREPVTRDRERVVSKPGNAAGEPGNVRG